MIDKRISSPYESGTVEWKQEPVEMGELALRLNEIGVAVKEPTVRRWGRSGKLRTTKLGRLRSTVAAALDALRPEAL